MAYAQSFALLKAASDHHGFDLRPDERATIGRGGCSIRARFLDRIREAHAEHPDFEADTCERIDRPGAFHSDWSAR